MAPTARIPISKPGHFGNSRRTTAPIKKISKSFNPYKFDCRYFVPERLAGEIFALDMDEEPAGEISANDCSYALDVHDFNPEDWHRNMSKRRFKCEDVMEYVVETFNWKRSLQEKYQPADIFQVQDNVTPMMRYDCVNWLVIVTRKMGFTLETFCLAVNFMDRFLCLQPIEGKCLQLVSELLILCGGACLSDQIQNMEKVMLSRLNWKLEAPTSCFFLEMIVEVEDELDWPVDLARHLVEMALSDPVIAKLRPLQIANGVRQIIKGCPLSLLISISNNCPKCDPQSEKDDFDLIEGFFENLVKELLQCEY